MIYTFNIEKSNGKYRCRLLCYNREEEDVPRGSWLPFDLMDGPGFEGEKGESMEVDDESVKLILQLYYLYYDNLTPA